MPIPASSADPRHSELTVPVYADWRAALADAVTDSAELTRMLGLPPSVALSAREARRSFSLVVPRTYLSRIRPGDPNDPLLLQVLPREEELSPSPLFTADPLGEAHATRAPGLLGKYQGRLLIVTSGVCAVHCRFCFRRHFPYGMTPSAREQWEGVAAQVAADNSVREVILSGGDPLSLEDDRLGEIIRLFDGVGHLRRLRIHTRLPIVIPQRVTEELIQILRETRLAPFIAVHVNHPAEIDASVEAALGRLVDAGIPVLSQSVLLRRVNDDLDVLAELFERLVNLRVIPYYLHQLDRVSGAAHFEVPEETGIALIHQLRARLPGYAVPRYVRESPSASNKVVLA